VPARTRRGSGTSRRSRQASPSATRTPRAELAPRCDAAVRIVRRVGAHAPESQLLVPRALRQQLKLRRIPASATLEEVRSCGPDCDESEVDVDAVARPDDIPEQPSEVVDAVSRRLGRQSNPSTEREQPLRRGRRLPAVALRPEVDLGRVDLDKPNALAVAKFDGVAVDDVIDAVRGVLARFSRPGDRERHDKRDERRGEASVSESHGVVDHSSGRDPYGVVRDLRAVVRDLLALDHQPDGEAAAAVVVARHLGRAEHLNRAGE
jgi:hypothetical protein